MNVFNMHVALGAAGALILQLAVITYAQQTTPSSAPSPGSSASPAGKTAGAESSQSQDGSRTAGSASGAITQSVKAGGKGDPAFGGERHPLYRLANSDTLDVNFTFSPEFNQTVTVQPDGFVALKGAGTVLAEGFTVPEMQLAIANAYRAFLHEPEVTVSLKDFNKPYFLASGEVARPGKYSCHEFGFRYCPLPLSRAGLIFFSSAACWKEDSCYGAGTGLAARKMGMDGNPYPSLGRSGGCFFAVGHHGRLSHSAAALSQRAQ
jgi:hypothetical protein